MRTSAMRYIVAGSAALALLLAPGCGTKLEIVKIGAILPLAGTNTELGNQYLHGLTLAIEELNASSDLVQYRLVVDDGSDAQRAGAAFSKQLTTDKITAVVTATDEAALAAGPKAEQQFVPLFANCDHPFVITMLRDVFRNSPSTMYETKKLFEFVASSLKAKTIGFFYADDPPGKLVAQAIKNEIAPSGLQLAVSEPFDAAGADPRSSAAALLAWKPDVVFIHGSGAPAAQALAAIRKLGFRGPVCGSRDFARPGVIAAASSAVEGCYVAVPAFALAARPEFEARYRARFNAEPTPSVVIAYDAMMIIAKADRARRFQEISLANALKKVGDYNGMAGTYLYADREWLPPMRIVRIEGSKPVVVR